MDVCTEGLHSGEEVRLGAGTAVVPADTPGHFFWASTYQQADEETGYEITDVSTCSFTSEITPLPVSLLNVTVKLPM